MKVEETHFLFDQYGNIHKIYRCFSPDWSGQNILEVAPGQYTKMTNKQFNILTNTGRLELND